MSHVPIVSLSKPLVLKDRLMSHVPIVTVSVSHWLPHCQRRDHLWNKFKKLNFFNEVGLPCSLQSLPSSRGIEAFVVQYMEGSA